jgi:hypothetical protein
MMAKAGHRPFQAFEHIQIRGLGSQRHRGCGQRGFAIKSGTSEAGTGQEVSYGFQGLRSTIDVNVSFADADSSLN